MKKNKLKTLVKSAKKEAKLNIEKKLVAGLTQAAGELSSTSKKLGREIAKSAKQLAKKLSKEIKIDKAALAAGTKDVKAEVKPKPVKTETPKTAPVKAVPVKKAVTPAKSTLLVSKAVK